MKRLRTGGQGRQPFEHETYVPWHVDRVVGLTCVREAFRACWSVKEALMRALAGEEQEERPLEAFLSEEG
jgi:hypothetical protein